MGRGQFWPLRYDLNSGDDHLTKKYTPHIKALTLVVLEICKVFISAYRYILVLNVSYCHQPMPVVVRFENFRGA